MMDMLSGLSFRFLLATLCLLVLLQGSMYNLFMVVFYPCVFCGQGFVLRISL